MARIFRRAANKVKSSLDAHGSLGLLIFEEKVVHESFQKVVMAQANASISMLKWAKSEDNLAIQDVFSKLFEVSSMWTAVWKDFTQEYCKYRKSFKEILKEEKVLDEERKWEAIHTTKMNRLQKQLDQNKRKSDGLRPHSISNEMLEVITQAEQEQAELEVKTTKHEIFKAQKLRESMYQISDGLKQWASKTLLVAEVYRKLANLITDTPTQLTENKVFHGTGKSRSIVNDLARDLYIDPELSRQLATMSHSAQSYLYAVSTPVLAVKYDYVDFTTAQNPAKANAKAVSHKWTPQPLRHQHHKPQDNLKLGHDLGRPRSLTDLRPPPNLPPPPLPKSASGHVTSKQSPGHNWYASTNISSDSDPDSEGYTKPYTEPRFVQKKMLWKVLSDGAIYKADKDYEDREPATHFYHDPLERRTYSQEDFSDDSDPATYVDLINN